MSETIGSGLPTRRAGLESLPRLGDIAVIISDLAIGSLHRVVPDRFRRHYAPETAMEFTNPYLPADFAVSSKVEATPAPGAEHLDAA
jgi:hypothetical protein